MINLLRHCRKALLVGGLAVLSLAYPSCATAGKFHTMYTFKGGADGELPHSVIEDALGNLYGTTASGGDTPCSCGTVFKIAPGGLKTILHAFKGRKDGAHPFFGGLISDGLGNLYGTTEGFGTENYGTVFKLDANLQLSTLHTFKKPGDGRNPLAGVVMDEGGNLYGTTIRGGRIGHGAVYKIAPDGKESVLHSFLGTTMEADGDSPAGALILDGVGNLYGTTGYGGSNNCGTPGCGTVFKVSPTGDTTILYRFLGNDDGEFPVGNLAMDHQGNLFGMTQRGGDGAGFGGGLIFKLAPDGTKSTLYKFHIDTGGVPEAGLIIDGDGNLYGTAQGGAYGYGVAFELTFEDKYRVLHDFTGGADRREPSANNLTLGLNGELFGATTDGLVGCCGSVFRIRH